MIPSKRYSLCAAIAMLLASCLLCGAVWANGDQALPAMAAASQPAYLSTIFDQSQVMSIDIQMSESDWAELLENATDEEYAPCDLVVNGQTYYNVGIRAKGNSSLSMVASSESDRYSFKLKFDEYVDGQTLDGLSKLVVNNNIGDATYMKEYLSYHMMESMGVPSPACSYADLTVNGQAWGLYLAVEPLEEEFLARWYGADYGNLYKVESTGMGGGDGKAPAKGDGWPQEGMGQPPEQAEPPQNQLISGEEGMQGQENPQAGQRGMGGMGGGSSGGSLVYTDGQIDSYAAVTSNAVLSKTGDSDKQKVVDMIDILNNGGDLESVLNVDEVLRYFAVNTFLVNLDSYAGSMKHNYYLYEDDGVFSILPWDFNLSFGAFNMQEASSVVNFPIDTPVTDTMENSPLISKLLEVDEYKQIYHQYLEQLVLEWQTSGRMNAEIAGLDSLIAPYVQADATAFYTFEEYQASLPQLMQLCADRGDSILAQLAGEQPSDSYGTLATSVDLQALGSQTMGGGRGQQPQDGQAPGGGAVEAGAMQLPQERRERRAGVDGAISPPGQQSNARADWSAVILLAASLALTLAGAFLMRRYRRRDRAQ